MSVPWLALASGAFLIADQIYQHYNDEPDSKRRRNKAIETPRIEAGTTVPLIFGRCRVDSPVLADIRVVNRSFGDTSPDDVVLVDMLFQVGVPMDDGRGDGRLLDMWSGDARCVTTQGADADGKWTQTGNGGPEATIATSIEDAGEGRVEVLNGNPAQVLAVDGATNLTATTWAGRRMLSDALTPARTVDQIPGFRGYLSAFLFNITDGSGWSIGGMTSTPVYGFEASSYPATTSGYPATAPWNRVNTHDANPMDVLWDLFAAKFKLGIDASTYLDLTSFRAAAQRLYGEANGYSRAVEDPAELAMLALDVLKQSHGVLYEEPSTGKLHVKLLRADYNPSTIPHITKLNCRKIVNYAHGNFDDLPNAIRVTFRNRELDYAEDHADFRNQAGAAGQTGEVRWQVLSMLGVTNRALAYRIAQREMSWRSQPMIKFRALVDRDFIGVRPGDALKVSWSRPDISGVFRCIGVDLGTLNEGLIGLDVVRDASTYTFRGFANPIPEIKGDPRRGEFGG